MPRILKLSTKSCHWRQPCIGTWQIVSSRCTKPAEERFYFVKYLLVVSAVHRLELPRPALGRAPPPEHWAASAMVTMLVPDKYLQCSLHGIILESYLPLIILWTFLQIKIVSLNRLYGNARAPVFWFFKIFLWDVLSIHQTMCVSFKYTKMDRVFRASLKLIANLT